MNPYLSVDGGGLVKAIKGLPEHFGDALTEKDGVQIFLYRVAYGDDFFTSVMDALALDGDVYIDRCLKENAPLLFPQAIARAGERSTIRKYIQVPSTPLVEAYIQDGSVFVGSVTELRKIGPFTSKQDAQEAAKKAAFELLTDMYAAYCNYLTSEEAAAFIGLSYQDIPSCIQDIDNGSSLWLLDNAGTISEVVTMDPPEDDAQADVDLYVVSPLFATVQEKGAEDVMASLRAAVKPASDKVKVMDGFYKK